MKTILITGASSGIGKETAILFAEQGWNVAAAVRNDEKLLMFADYKNIRPYHLDVNKKESVISGVEQVIKDYGQIDVIVNNAGIYTTNPLEMTSDGVIYNIINTNIKGVLHTTKIVLAHFRENKSGTIINVSSMAGRAAFPFQSVYHASKWAVEGFTESLYYELKPMGIRVKIIEPGIVKTNLYESVSDFTFENYPLEYQDSFVKGYYSQLDKLKNGYDPRLDAKTIYKAANSRSNRLRYTTDNMTKFTLFLNRFLPLCVFRSIIKKINRL